MWCSSFCFFLLWLFLVIWYHSNHHKIVWFSMSKSATVVITWPSKKSASVTYTFWEWVLLSWYSIFMSSFFRINNNQLIIDTELQKSWASYLSSPFYVWPICRPNWSNTCTVAANRSQNLWSDWFILWCIWNRLIVAMVVYHMEIFASIWVHKLPNYL